jgi:hypothetical protein
MACKLFLKQFIKDKIYHLNFFLYQLQMVAEDKKKPQGCWGHKHRNTQANVRLTLPGNWVGQVLNQDYKVFHIANCFM